VVTLNENNLIRPEDLTPSERRESARKSVKLLRRQDVKKRL